MKLISLFPGLLLLTSVKRNRNFISKECTLFSRLKPCLKYFLFQQNLMMINEGWHVSTTKNFEQITFFFVNF